MILLQTLVTGFYYLLVAFVSALMIWNLARSDDWREEVLYAIVLVPFLLRLFHLK